MAQATAAKKTATNTNTNAGNRNAPATTQQRQNTAVGAPAGVHLQMPEYLAQAQKGQARGSEHVQVEDIVIPRLEVVQALSPCLKRNDPEYIEGAEPGMLYNNVTRELYGDSVLLMPIYFRKEFLVWVDRKKQPGSKDGFRGSFATAELAARRIEEADEDDLQVVDTAQQFCMLVHTEQRVEEVVVSMARSKMKVSRRWNSLIRLAGGDRFSRIYKMSSVEEKGKKGDYHNFAVDQYGFPSKPLYELAIQKYESIAQGNVKADVSGNTYDPDDEGASQDGTQRSRNADY